MYIARTLFQYLEQYTRDYLPRKNGLKTSLDTNLLYIKDTVYIEVNTPTLNDLMIRYQQQNYGSFKKQKKKIVIIGYVQEPIKVKTEWCFSFGAERVKDKD